MDFRFSDEQRMIRDTAAAFLAEVSDSAAVRAAMATEIGYDRQLWQRICGEMYLQATHIPESCGGMGLGYVELVAIMEQMGRYLLCAPFFSTVCLAGNALLVAGSAAQQQEYLAQIAAGELTATLAHTGVTGEWGAQGVTAVYRQRAGQYVLDGKLRYVVDGHTADLLLVAAREEGSSGEQGISLFAVPAASAGIERTWLPTVDQTRKLAEIGLSGLAVPASALLGEAGAAWPDLSKTLDLATIALAAEQMGGTQRVLDMTVDYTRERVQFNRPIASFQAVKHIAADMMLKAEVARSAVYYAGCIAQEALSGDALGAELPEAASVAKAYCSDAYFANSADALQLHGGVGFTWEYDVHLYLKRAKASEHFLGNGAHHRERVASLLLDTPNA
ncbi:MAG: acyl-CoA/acyl-ACP dehydrogenase [Halioglobus sp.]|nr:acyl-CoA/acyl-ACP dehydrogenase [Halioglobus sp.]